MNIFNKFIPKQLYSTSKHNVLAIVFVLFVVLVVQRPTIFSKSANTLLEKVIILLIIILLTNYNSLIGLAAAIVALVFYAKLFETGCEGLENMETAVGKPAENAPKQDTSNGTGISSTPSLVSTSENSLTSPSAPPATVDLANTVPLATPIENPQDVSQMEKKYSGQINMTPQDSNAIPYTPMQNPNVQPSESSGNTKSTSDATTLKPSGV
jgi:hypothetical protein